MKKLGNLTLRQLLLVRIQYLEEINQCLTDDAYEYNNGKIHAYNVILNDIDSMDKDDCLALYCKRLISFSRMMEELELSNIRVKEFDIGENNAIVEFLSLINPEFENFESIDEFYTNRVELYCRVQLLTNAYIYFGVVKGAKGIVIEDYKDGTCEVQFEDVNGEVTDLFFAVCKNELRRIDL